MLVHTSRRFIYYLFEFKYFNYLYKKNTKLLLQKKKKNYLTQIVKTTHSYPEFLWFFFFFNSLKHFKIFVIQFLCSYISIYPC